MSGQRRYRPVFLLVRHGVTVPQQEGRYCGHADPPLAPAGVAQMQRLARALALRFPRFDAVVTSDLSRATASAALLAGTTPVLALPELREINFGTWEGLRYEETGCRDAEALRSLDFRFPGGESAALLYARVERALPAILAAAGPVTLIVAHAGSLAMLACRLRGESKERFWEHRLPHGGVDVIAMPGENARAN